MKNILFLFLLISFARFAFGQNPAATPVKLTHVERFNTLEARAAKIETDTTEKLKSTKTDASLFNERALARIRLKKLNEAAEDLVNAINLKPNDAEFRANYGYVLWKLNKFQEAINAEREALKLDEKNYTANYQLGRFLIRTGDKTLLKEATEKLRKAIEIDPREYEVRFELVAAFRELGDIAAAVRQLEFLQDAKPSDARVSYISGLLAIDKGDTKLAVERLNDALRKDENLFGAWQDLGLLYAKTGRWKESSETFTELTKRQPTSVEASYFLALSFFNSQRPKEAEAEIRRTLRLDSGSADAHSLLGIILLSGGKSNGEAMDSLLQAVALQPNNFDANFYLGRVQYASREYANALKSLQKSVEIKPANVEARFFLGTVFEALGESEKALNEYREIVKLDEKSFFGQVGLGALLAKQGKIDDAIISLNRAIALDKNSFEANWALGRVYILQEKFAEAENVLQKAVSLQPNRTDARYQLGLALRRLGKPAEAKREFDLVEKLNREFREGKDNQ
jgi:tetratricopeptide (TPR) repeat protein